jgi:hypothetical protein
MSRNLSATTRSWFERSRYLVQASRQMVLSWKVFDVYDFMSTVDLRSVERTSLVWVEFELAGTYWPLEIAFPTGTILALLVTASLTALSNSPGLHPNGEGVSEMSWV